jgi:radical SAM superfamily enzyme YgiQ (UPF0313 family)
MGSRVLLISPNRCATPDVVFPLGLSHLNAALRRAGHETCWLDFNADTQPFREPPHNPGVSPARTVSGESLAKLLDEFRPRFVGISVRNIDDVIIRKRETYYKPLEDICAEVRRTHPCPVILGGSGFSIFPRELLELSGADFGIQGEGETALLDLISALSEGKDVSSIPGLVYRRGPEIVVNPQQPAQAPELLDCEDWPSRLVDHYLKHSGMLNLQTQRGCAHACCYCTYPLIEGRAHRNRPPEVVAEEMARLEGRGAKYAFIVDSVFNSSPRHVTRICEALIRRNLKIRWGCFMRPQGLTGELMEMMARAGLSHIEFGADSFCDAVLEVYDKRLTFDDILQSSELAHQQKLDYCHFLICGGPGETVETLETSFQNSLRLKGAIVMACVGMRIYPGTTLHERALREHVVAGDADLLPPTYYIAPGLKEGQIFDMLQVFAKQSPNWIVGDPTPGYGRLVERLRARGVTGPLWSYFSLVQRIWPSTPSEAIA